MLSYYVLKNAWSQIFMWDKATKQSALDRQFTASTTLMVLSAFQHDILAVI
jgi:hypothetical protein